MNVTYWKMKNFVFLLFLLTSLQQSDKKQLLWRNRNQIYKIKSFYKSTIEIGSNDEDEDIMVKIFAFYIYKMES
jgi:hypothetical protein